MVSPRRFVVLVTAALLPTGLTLVVPLGDAAAEPRPVQPSMRTTAMHAEPRGGAADRSLSSSDRARAQQVQAAHEGPGRRSTGPSTVRVQATSDAALPSGAAVVGATWREGTGAGASVQYRTLTRGRWTAWTFLDTSDDHGPDAAEAKRAELRAGSDPLAVTGATRVQLRVLGDDSSAAAAPEIVVVDPGTSPADPEVGTSRPGAAQAVASRPVIYTRKQWGADESLRDPSGPSYGAVKAAVVHHTVDANGYSSSQVPALIRGIYAFHVKGRGWSDIGYNFLVDRFGRTWEGRYGGTTLPVIGAHTLDHNSWTTGVSVIGNYDTATVPAGVTTALRNLIAWKAQLHEFNPAGISDIGGLTTGGVLGHRDAYQTTCPGRYLYAQVPGLRSSAGAIVKGLPSLSLDRDLDDRGDADVLATTAENDLLLYPTTNQKSLLAPKVLSRRQWVGMDQVSIVGDFSGDGAADLVAREVATGRLYLYRGSGLTGLLRSRQLIGSGWSSFDRIVSVSDWNGDGHPDLLARGAQDGTLRLYPGNGVGGFLRSTTVGSGWSGMRLLTGVGDWTGDGARDLLAVSTTGVARIYPGNGRGGFVTARALNGDWSRFVSVVGVGDASWDTRTDVLAVDASGVAQMGLGGSTNTVTWVPVSTSLAGISVYTG